MQLSRILTAPLVVDVRPGAVADLGTLLADRRIATEGRVAVAVGPGQGDSVLADLDPAPAQVFRVEDGTVDSAVALGKRLRADAYEAVAGIGGGRTLDVTKFAAHMAGVPMVAVATNLAHDGIASPVSSLEHESGKGSYGVVPPVAVIVDLDRVRNGPPRSVRSGIGDVVNNLSAIADWELAAADRGEPLDGLAVTLARTAAQAVLHQPGTVADDEFLTVLAESLVLSGIAMTVAGSSRPGSGGDHEILHAIEQLYPGTGNHGELAGVGALFCTYLRGDERGCALLSACLARHGLPRTPADLGLDRDQFTKAVLHAPATRPGRYTILERLALDEAAITERVGEFTSAFGSPASRGGA
jgi:glycerol-1-phosphate dehydrogenase [NAD(P)+]